MDDQTKRVVEAALALDAKVSQHREGGAQWWKSLPEAMAGLYYQLHESAETYRATEKQRRLAELREASEAWWSYPGQPSDHRPNTPLANAVRAYLEVCDE